MALLVTGMAGCGGEEEAADRPSIVVTTNVLGDVVEQMVGNAARVEVLMPPGTDPHEFAASARQVAELRSADALVASGLGLEGSLADTIEAARSDGVLVITATDALPAATRDRHFYTDPVLMRTAAAGVAAGLAASLPALDTPAVAQRTGRYLAALAALDGEVGEVLADVPEARRVLVTNHEVLGPFARRYGFEVLGAVRRGGSTLAEPGAADLAALADLLAARDVPVVFGDASSSSRLIDALAAEGTGVRVETLYTESLGGSGTGATTYVDMVRTNARRIAAALGQPDG